MGDDSWFHHFESETKRQSMESDHLNSPSQKKARTVLSVVEVMGTVSGMQKGGFWQSVWNWCMSGHCTSSARCCAINVVKQKSSEKVGRIWKKNGSRNLQALHMEWMSWKGVRMLAFLKCNYCRCNRSLKQMLYFSFVQSVLDYVCILWDLSAKGLVEKLEKCKISVQGLFWLITGHATVSPT